MKKQSLTGCFFIYITVNIDVMKSKKEIIRDCIIIDKFLLESLPDYSDVYKQDPDKFGTTFIFNIHPDQLPKINRILSQVEIQEVYQASHLADRVKNINEIHREGLKKYFPKPFKRFNSSNPFI